MSSVIASVLGQGADMVLIHGWGFHHGVWQSVVPKLSEHFRLHLVDIPGFGTQSQRPLNQATINRWAQKIASDVPDQAIWCGWSLGGMIATQVAIEMPDKVSKLITTGCNLSFCQRTDWACAMKPSVLAGFKDQLVDDHHKTLLQFLSLQSLGAEDAKSQIRLLKKQVYAHGQPALSALEDGLTQLLQVDLRESVKAILCPSLHLFGRLDALVPVKAASRINEAIANSTVSVDAKSSHAPFISNPRWWLEQVLQFAQAPLPSGAQIAPVQG